jgi:hypothetical protein
MEIYPKKNEEFFLSGLAVFVLMAFVSTYLWLLGRLISNEPLLESWTFLRDGLAYFISSLVGLLLLWRVRSAKTTLRVLWRSYVAACGAVLVYGIVATWGVRLFGAGFFDILAPFLLPFFVLVVAFCVGFLFVPVAFFLWRRQQKPSCDRWVGLPWIALSFLLASLAPFMVAASHVSVEEMHPVYIDLVAISFYKNDGAFTKFLLDQREAGFYAGLVALGISAVLFLVVTRRTVALARWITRVAKGEIKGWQSRPVQGNEEESHLPLFSPEFASPNAVLLKLSSTNATPYREEENLRPVALIPSTPIPKTKIGAFFGVMFMLLFMAVFSLALDHFDSWKQLQSPTSENLKAIWGASPEMIFAVGEHGTILRTTTRGDSWTQLNSGTDQNLNAVWGSTENDLYAIGDGILLHSDDAGLHWEQAELPEKSRISTMFGASALDVYLGGDGVLLVGSFKYGWKEIDYKHWHHKYSDNIADPRKLLWVNDNVPSDEAYFYFLSTFQEQFKAYTIDGQELTTHRAGVTAMWVDKYGALYTPNTTVEKDGVWGAGGANDSAALTFFSRYNWQGVKAVWGDNRGNVIAVGAQGFITANTKPEEWQEQLSATDENLNGVWGDTLGNFYAVGDHGVILWWHYKSR